MILFRRRKQKEEKKKIETSKVLLYYCDALLTATVILTFVVVFIFKDPSPLSYMIPGVFGLATAAHGFYYWKAKAENLRKHNQADKVTMSGGDDQNPAGY